MTLPFKQIIGEPSLKDLLDFYRKEIFLSLNCHAIATIQSFDSVNQTVVAQINYSKVFFERDPSTTEYVQKLVNYPLLVDVPVISLCGGSAYLTFPIAQGDQALILFNDRDIENWFQGALAGEVASPRLHSFSDGIALVGLNDIASYDANRVVLANGTAYVGVGTELIKIANGITTLNTLLQSLITTIKAITTLNSDLTTGAVSAASQTALSSVASNISGLLE